ncbi:MAG TPA: MATE family efflux transporter, partial [Dielma fastidiosa]|nr:MATE family efflux transporter [Dielma fastidiosa]
MEVFMTKDMTSGNPTQLILGFAVPLLLGNIFQQLYNMVDSIIVGRGIGVDALAAVGATGSINFLVLGFVIGLTTGFSILISQYYGANDLDEMKRSVTMSVYLSIGATILITTISVLG